MSTSDAIAVYCGSSPGNQPAFKHAAVSLGEALASRSRPLVYGGGSKGIMGIVSAKVLEGGGKVTGIIPFAMIAAGGEGSRVNSEGGVSAELNDGKAAKVSLEGEDKRGATTIVVASMHERKVEMAKRSVGFVGLPGGFGTFEEVLEVTTWTQLGIHAKPVILLNVLNFYSPLRQLVQNAISAGFISAANENLMVFIDGPPSLEDHSSFDWGKAALDAIDGWKDTSSKPLFDWTKRMDNNEGDSFGAT